MTMIIYADFACPLCYLASRRVDALRAAGVEVDWRAVECHPKTPIAGAHLDAARLDTLITEFAELTGMLLPGEKLPWTMPTGIPKTEAAVSAYAEACGAGVADDVRRLLFAMCWEEGVDIGSPSVLRTALAGPILRGNSTADPLRESGYAVTVDRRPITTGAYKRIRLWRNGWQQLGPQLLPALPRRRRHTDRGRRGSPTWQRNSLRGHDTNPGCQQPAPLPQNERPPVRGMGVTDRSAVGIHATTDHARLNWQPCQFGPLGRRGSGRSRQRRRPAEMLAS